jgi:hypothetical protein
MKRILRSFALGLLVGGLAGLGAGMNIAKGQPLLSNPFAKVPVAERAGRAAKDAADKAGEGLEAAGEAAQEKLE